MTQSISAFDDDMLELLHGSPKPKNDDTLIGKHISGMQDEGHELRFAISRTLFLSEDVLKKTQVYQLLTENCAGEVMRPVEPLAVLKMLSSLERLMERKKMRLELVDEIDIEGVCKVGTETEAAREKTADARTADPETILETTATLILQLGDSRKVIEYLLKNDPLARGFMEEMIGDGRKGKDEGETRSVRVILIFRKWITRVRERMLA